MAASAHVDTFARDNLPPRADWPDLTFDLPELKYPDRLNCVTELLDRWIVSGHGEEPCLISPVETLSYWQLAERVNRIANVLVRDLGLVPGNRVLLRAPRGLFCRHEGGRRCGGNHAAAAREGALLSDREGEDCIGAL